MATVTRPSARPGEGGPTNGHYHLVYFSQLLRRPVCTASIRDRRGRVGDLVFAVAEPYPELVGIFLEHGWGKPTEFIPWDRVTKIDDDAVFVLPAEVGGPYPPFVDQPGWILVDRHLMGRTILDIDDRRIEVVNDVRLLEARGRLLLVDVDISFNGFLRRWGFGWLHWIKDDLISWKYVQPLSLEDAVPTDRVRLSVTRNQLQELPSEDLADALEELSGQEQQALFSALDADKAAETLVETEPRAQRQIIAGLSNDQARTIFAEMTIAQVASVFASLAHEETTELYDMLPPGRADAVRAILAEQEATARDLVSPDFLARSKEDVAGQVLREIRRSGTDPKTISYVYVVSPEDHVLHGVVDLRDIVLSPDNVTLGDIMVSPVVSAQAGDLRDRLNEIFLKYHYRMIPVVDEQDRILGVIHHKDVIVNPEARA
jgi:CBS domain-containing protein/sporulation protein YlmC with PRC-barrel domain